MWQEFALDNFRKDDQVENKSSNGTIFTKETFGMLMVLFAVLCMVCLITKDAVLGQVGANISAFLLGALGYFAYPYFLLFAYYGVTLVIGKSIPFSKKTATFISLLFVLAVLLVHGITSARFGANSVNFSDLSYGKYLTACYDSGKSTATAGGVIAGVITFWGMRLFTYGGFYAVLGALIVVTVAGFVNYIRKGNTILKRGKVEVVKQQEVSSKPDSEQVSQQQEPTLQRYPNDPFYGVTDAPIKEEPKHKNPLFLADGADFNYLGKKEAPANIKLSNAGGGLYVAGVVEPKKVSPQDDLNAKLKYIKTPRTIDVEETLNRINNEPKKTSSSASVSSPIIRGEGKRVITTDYVPSQYQGFEDAPIIETPRVEAIPEDKPIGYNASTTDRAIDFNNRYIATPEVDEVDCATPEVADGIDEIFNREERATGSFSLINEIREKEAKKAEEARLEEERARLEEHNRLEALRKAEEEAKQREEQLKQEAERLERERLELEEQRRHEAEMKAELERLAEEEKRIKEEELKQQMQAQEDERISSINDVYFAGPEPTNEVIPEDKPERSRVIGFTSSQPKKIEKKQTDSVVTPSPLSSVMATAPVEELPEKKPEPINRPYYVPDFSILEDHKREGSTVVENHEANLHKIEEKLSHFKIPVEGKNYIQGPSFTRYEFSVSPDVSIRNVLKYDYDLMATLEVQDGVRILAPIPGKNLIGVEVANKVKTMVSLKEVLVETESKKHKKGSLMFAIGKNLIGEAIEDNLAKGPHYLVAGSTGSGKSVCLNSMLISLIMRYSPEDMKLILIDPKTVEFAPYEHLPHLVTDEIISDLKKVLAVLDWAIEEMERRYATFRACEESVVDIDGYNDTKDVVNGKIQRMPRIVIVIDELADLMAQIKRDIEGKIQRLTAKARSAGIHLVLATQRPSVDVITGVIKSNLPSRIAFKVMNFMDSQTILNEVGAEKLLGYGDMLYRNSGMPNCERYQGTFVSPVEINRVVKYIIENNEAYFNDELAQYLENAVKPPESDLTVGGDGGDVSTHNGEDAAFIQALKLVMSAGQASISMLQRRFQMGYPRAASMIDKMEVLGYVAPNEGSKARRILITEEQFNEKYGDQGEV